MKVFLPLAVAGVLIAVACAAAWSPSPYGGFIAFVCSFLALGFLVVGLVPRQKRPLRHPPSHHTATKLPDADPVNINPMEESIEGEVEPEKTGDLSTERPSDDAKPQPDKHSS